jgi:hypothetical protein
MLITVPAWLLNLVDDRALIGTTLILSWVTQITTSRTAVHVDKHDKG